MKIKQGRFKIAYLMVLMNSIVIRTSHSTLLKLFRSHKEKKGNLARGFMTLKVGGIGSQGLKYRLGSLYFL